MTGKGRDVMKKVHVLFQPSGKGGEIRRGNTILEASGELGIEIEAICGGVRTCGKCKVKIEKGPIATYGASSLPGHISAFQQEEARFIKPQERIEGYRLACVAKIRGDVIILVPEESRGGEAGGSQGSHRKIV